MSKVHLALMVLLIGSIGCSQGGDTPTATSVTETETPDITPLPSEEAPEEEAPEPAPEPMTEPEVTEPEEVEPTPIPETPAPEPTTENETTPQETPLTYTWNWEKIASGDVYALTLDEEGNPLGALTFTKGIMDLIVRVKILPWYEKIFFAIFQYPVSAIVQKGERIFAGTNGILLFTKDSGKSWKIADLLRRFAAKKGQNGEHETCGGEKQNGVTADRKGALISLNRVCDMAVLSSGRVLLAFDNGLVYNDHLEEHLKNIKAKQYRWIGTGKSNRNALFKKVVHDLYVANGKILAGTNKGVWVSNDEGESWSQLGLGDKKVLSVAAQGEKVLAVTDQGLYTMEKDEWKLLESTANATSVSANDSVIALGTDNGVVVFYDMNSLVSKYEYKDGSMHVRKIEVVAGDDAFLIYVAAKEGLYKLQGGIQ